MIVPEKRESVMVMVLAARPPLYSPSDGAAIATVAMSSRSRKYESVTDSSEISSVSATVNRSSSLQENITNTARIKPVLLRFKICVFIAPDWYKIGGFRFPLFDQGFYKWFNTKENFLHFRGLVNRGM